MKVRLHVTGNHKLEVFDPADDHPNPERRRKIMVHCVQLAVTSTGHEDGAFGISPSGVVHLNNLSEAAGALFEVGGDFTFEPVKPASA